MQFDFVPDVVFSGQMPGASNFLVEPDAKARAWLRTHPSTLPRVIDYDIHRCCGGGKICLVTVRDKSETDDPDRFVAGSMEDGTRFLIDHRAAARLPARFGLTVRGIGPLRHLDLNLEAEEWATLLYD
jgi:hypothetical protein